MLMRAAANLSGAKLRKKVKQFLINSATTVDKFSAVGTIFVLER
jgi:hypothetical protein